MSHNQSWTERIESESDYWLEHLTEEQFDFTMRWVGIAQDGWETGMSNARRCDTDDMLLRECMRWYEEKELTTYDMWRVRALFASLGMRQVKHALEAKGQADRTEDGGQSS